MANFITSLVNAWNKWPSSAKITISAATLFAFASAFVDVRSLWKDVFASPEKQLTELGYQQRTYDEFLRAVLTRHVEAVRLFSELGNRLKPQHFPELFKDGVYHSGVIAALVSSKAVSDEHCPTAGKSISIYLSYSSNQEKANLLRSICNTPRVLNSLQASLVEEDSRIEVARAQNAARTDTVNRCKERYRAEGEQRLFQEASRFNILSRHTYSERECVLANLNVALVTGYPAPGSSHQSFNTALIECCMTYNPEANVDSNVLVTLQGSIAFLSGKTI